ncbi:WD40-repeat-containing domain protein [Pilobolus umbonatus]|nr:WD40-repeat-containing domain protein [Pilobolus umbonatus]
MLVIKPEWVHHADRTVDARNKRPCIYSLHVHPLGKRLATGGLDGHVRIWNTTPIFDEKAQYDPTCHKLLCSMAMHNGAVLCVRWSNGDGRYLASSSDNDNVIIIWELDRNAESGSVFGSSEVNHEVWRAVKYLRAHVSDVQDLAWSKDNKYLASCGVDGYVIVWDGSTFEQITKIDQHGGFVKGVAWDPAGNFLASQSDDKMVKIWRTTDWKLETDIVSPFVNAPQTTLFRRLSWSPDGAHLAAANAVNGMQCIAAIINRHDWNADISLVGHQMPIEVTAFNPKMFYMRNMEEGNENNDTSLATICALGSQDTGISIWVTKFSRPVCVAQDIFDNNVYDLAWTPDGKSLFACSHDGSIVCIQLEEELKDIAPDEEINKELRKYGFGRHNTYLPETPIQLELEEENTLKNATSRMSDLMTGDRSIELPTSSEQPENPDIEMEGITDLLISSSSDLPTITEQKITIARNGKKRIQPVSLSTSTSTSSTDKSPATIFKNSKESGTPFNRESNVDHAYYDDPPIPPSGLKTSITGNKRRASEINGENEIAGGNAVRMKPQWIESAVVPSIVHKSQIKMGIPMVKSVLSRKLSKEDPTVVMECHNSVTNIEDNKVKSRTKVVISKQGTALWVDYLSTNVLLMAGNHLFSSLGCEDGSIHVYSPSGRRMLPPIVLESTPVILQCSSQWLLCLTATGLLYTWDIINFKSRLNAISVGPVLQIAKIPSDETKTTCSIRDVRIQKNGLVVIITNLNEAYLYHVDMNVWLRISDAWYIVSEFWGSGAHQQQALNDHPLGWLTSRMMVNQTMDSTTKLLTELAQTDTNMIAAITVSHIETQLAVAALLDSPDEYKEWMIYYARRLSHENAKEKVEELCRWLIGPPYVNTEFCKWEPTIMGTINKKDLLAQIIPILAHNRQLQRTIIQFRSCL